MMKRKIRVLNVTSLKNDVNITEVESKYKKEREDLKILMDELEELDAELKNLEKVHRASLDSGSLLNTQTLMQNSEYGLSKSSDIDGTKGRYQEQQEKVNTAKSSLDSLMLRRKRIENKVQTVEKEIRSESEKKSLHEMDDLYMISRKFHRK